MDRIIFLYNFFYKAEQDFLADNHDVWVKKTNKKRRKKMTQAKIKTGNTSVLQVLGGMLLVFAVADFALSWMWINLTQFMVPASRFSPIILGVIGSALMNITKEDG